MNDYYEYKMNELKTKQVFERHVYHYFDEDDI